MILCQNGSALRSIFIHYLLDQQIKDVPSSIYEKQLQATISLPIPLSLRVNPGIVHFPNQSTNCLLNELLFWMVKYQIPERLLKFFLMLLTDMEFKKSFLPSFLPIYNMVVAQWSQARGSSERRHSLRLIHLSVQLFSNSQIAQQAIDGYHLLEIMISSLYAIFSSIKSHCQLQNPRENYHFVISEKSFSKTMYYWPLISDWINVLSHPYASRTFLTDKRYFITWIEMISWFQGQWCEEEGLCNSIRITIECD